ncbi:MAG: hypothetical protein HZR80_10735 [Candidatus Heimdallarchaeota archaeon]
MLKIYQRRIIPKKKMIAILISFTSFIISLTLLVCLSSTNSTVRGMIIGFLTFLLVISIIAFMTSLVLGVYNAVEPTTKKELILSQIKASKYRIEKENICMICKFEIDKHEMIYTCPYCNSLYHKDHFQQWLDIDTTCPVCNQDLYKHALKIYKQTKR